MGDDFDQEERDREASEARWLEEHRQNKETRWQVIYRTALLVLVFIVGIGVLILLIQAAVKCPPEAAGGPCI